jgi:hypothetical protein
MTDVDWIGYKREAMGGGSEMARAVGMQGRFLAHSRVAVKQGAGYPTVYGVPAVKYYLRSMSQKNTTTCYVLG